jgi:putative endonuclease
MRASGPVSPLRQAAYRRGHRAEWLAAALLIAKGFTILSRRHAGHGGEIDLVARRGTLLLFVEVKERSDLDAAVVSITAEKRRRFARAARHYLARNPWSAAMTVRCDAVFLAPWRWPRHVPDAFRLEE